MLMLQFGSCKGNVLFAEVLFYLKWNFFTVVGLYCGISLAGSVSNFVCSAVGSL